MINAPSYLSRAVFRRPSISCFSTCLNHFPKVCSSSSSFYFHLNQPITPLVSRSLGGHLAESYSETFQHAQSNTPTQPPLVLVRNLFLSHYVRNHAASPLPITYDHLHPVRAELERYSWAAAPQCHAFIPCYPDRALHFCTDFQSLNPPSSPYPSRLD